MVKVMNFAYHDEDYTREVNRIENKIPHMIPIMREKEDIIPATEEYSG